MLWLKTNDHNLVFLQPNNFQTTQFSSHLNDSPSFNDLTVEKSPFLLRDSILFDDSSSQLVKKMYKKVSTIEKDQSMTS